MKRMKLLDDTEIIIGKNIDLSHEIREYNKLLLISDSNVIDIYGREVISHLTESNKEVYKFILKAGEESKNIDIAMEAINFMSMNGFSSADAVVTLGGGVTTDLGGFISSIYNRGINVYHIPTTLLADVDASIGGKTAVNTDYGKNIAGTFHDPVKVMIDTQYLKTLTNKDIMNGKAEILKYAFIENLKLLELIKGENWEDIIKESLKVKIKFIETDKFDKGERMKLNFGHTIGHAIEKQSNYKINHGEAIAIGMATMGRYFNIKGIEKELKDNDLKVRYDADTNDLINYVRLDKKRKGSLYNIIIPLEMGKCEIYKAKEEEIFDMLKRVRE